MDLGDRAVVGALERVATRQQEVDLVLVNQRRMGCLPYHRRRRVRRMRSADVVFMAIARSTRFWPGRAASS
jgi:hypothetical protein